VYGGRFAVALCAILCACVDTPGRTAGPEPFKAGGLPLSAAVQVGILVSAAASLDDPGSGAKREDFSIGQAEAIAEAFRDGFRAHMPNVNVQMADTLIVRPAWIASLGRSKLAPSRCWCRTSALHWSISGI
jgi:hypothetical protein